VGAALGAPGDRGVVRVRAIHVVPAVSEEASGPSYSVPRLCESLIASGLDVTLATLDWAPSASAPSYQKKFPLGFGPRQLGVSPPMRNWLAQESRAGRADILHNHGLWMMPNVYTSWARRGARARLVVSPRGTLSDWALAWHPLRKKIFWRFWQEDALRAADCFHATSPEECADVRRRGFLQPIAILPNGIDVPPLLRTPSGSRRRLLFLGRIHPIKGIDLLLRAWRSVQDRFADWELHVAGPEDDSGYLNKMKSLASDLSLERVVFRGPVFGADKLQAYREAELFVLPTRAENFGMTVAEALAAGTPTITTRGAPWNGLDKKGAGWWIDLGLEPLAACLEKALAEPAQRLAAMGRAGRDWMLEDYAWPSIVVQHAAVYRWLLEGGAAPSCVRTS